MSCYVTHLETRSLYLMTELFLLSHFRLVGGLLTINQEYCFVVEDEKGVCSYALAALDAKMFQQRSQNAWIPAMCEKYPKPVKDELTPADVSIYLG